MPPDLFSPLEFFRTLKWLDGTTPLLEHLEPYRLKIFQESLYSFDEDGTAKYDLILCGRGKKNFKSSDLILSCAYVFFVRSKHNNKGHNSDCLIVANDLDQSRDDLKIFKRLLEVNEPLQQLVTVRANKIVAEDGSGTVEILAARDTAGSHGKSYAFLGYDEIHEYRDFSLIEALAKDPGRESFTWITSYDAIHAQKNAPLQVYKRMGFNNEDPKMYFSWYSGDPEFCTDPAYKDPDMTPERRANPSFDRFPKDYFASQRRRLPTSMFRRLHLNLPSAPEGSFFDSENILACIVQGRKRLKPILREANSPSTPVPEYMAFTDLSGGSYDNATLAIAFRADYNLGEDEEPSEKIKIACLEQQAGEPPFNPRLAVAKFAQILKSYGLTKVTGDAYAGNTFARDFEDHGIQFEKCPLPKSDLYLMMEPLVNAQLIELLDDPTLESQLLTLTTRGSKVDHPPGGRDDHANSVAGAIWLCRDDSDQVTDLDGISGLEKESHWNDFTMEDDTCAAERTHKGLLW